VSTDDRIQEIVASGVIAILPVERGEDVLPIAEAITEAGGGALEVVPASLDLLSAIGQARIHLGRNLLLGVGGIVGGDAAWEVIRAGAAFVSSPHLDPEVLRFCREEGVPGLPSALTPTEMAHAWDLGAGLVKLFPAGAVGAEFVRWTLHALAHLRVVAAGGVPVEGVGEFVRAGATAIGVEIETGDGAGQQALREIGRRVRAYADAVERARGQVTRPAPPVRPVEGPDVR
jgi:2-dehydro-3-deoxyphosphogluconate aldolase / (4S)-4-hydroxy-2-oxoglutarate aldolase